MTRRKIAVRDRISRYFGQIILPLFTGAGFSAKDTGAMPTMKRGFAFGDVTAAGRR